MSGAMQIPEMRQQDGPEAHSEGSRLCAITNRVA